MSDTADIIKQYIQIRNQFRSKSRGRNNDNSFIIKKQDIYHNNSSKARFEQNNSQIPAKNQFSLDLSKIKVNNPAIQQEETPCIENNSYLQFQQDLDFQFDIAVQDQIQMEKLTKQKQLYIPNLNKYLEDFKKRKYQSPSVSQRIIGKNPYQNAEFPQQYVEKLANDMMQSYKEGKTCAKYDQIMDFVKGKPFFLKLGEMNYRQSEKNKINLQDQPSSLQYQHIRTRNLQMGERPLSKEKRREQEQQAQVFVDKINSKNIKQSRMFVGRSSSIQYRREIINSQISMRDNSQDNQIQSERQPITTPKAQYLIWDPPNMNNQNQKDKLNGFLSHQGTPRGVNQVIPSAYKKFQKEISLSKSTFDAGLENDFTIEQPSTKQSPNINANRSKQVSPINNQSQDSYNTFLTQDFVQQGQENTNQKIITQKKNDKNNLILLEGDENNDKSIQMQQNPQINKKNHQIDHDLLKPQKHNFQFEKQAILKLNLKLDDQLKIRSQQSNRNSQTHRERPGSESRQEEFQKNSKVSSPLPYYRIQSLSRNKPRSVASRRFPQQEDSLENLACGSILNDCDDILKGSSIQKIGQPNYFNEKFYEKNCKQNEKKHNIKMELVSIWQKSKERYKIRKENLLSEVEEQARLVKQYKDEQPLIKTQLQKSGAIIDRYFQSLNVVKPFFQKKIQSKSIV